MTKSELDAWRKRVPWFIFTIGLVPYFIVTAKDLEAAKLRTEVIAPIIAVIAAFFYVGMGIPRRLWEREMKAHVGKQIREALLKMIPKDLGVTEGERNELAEHEINRSITGVFWEAVDGSEMLRSQKESFYSNGIVYSTSIDVFIIGLILSACYIIASVLEHSRGLLYVAIGCAAIGVASRTFVTPNKRKVHLRYSNDQLDFLGRERSDFVSERFRSIVTGWRARRLLK